MRKDKPQKVFISHSWKDKIQAEKLYKALNDFCGVWMDYRELKPGDAIQQAINQTLAEMDLVLVVWTGQTMNSEGVAAEIETALRLGKRVIPCIFHYDDQGQPSPKLSGPLATLLGVDFHHFGTGVARLTTFLLQLQLGDNTEYINDPRMHMLQELDGLLDYLSNYRNARNLEAPRSQWVDWIIDVIEKYAKDGGDPTVLETVLEAARRNQSNDPEALRALTQRLESLPIAHRKEKKGAQAKVQKAKKAGRQKKYRDSRDMLARRISEVAPAGKEQQWNNRLEYYIQSAPAILSALQMYAIRVSSPAGCEVVNYLNTYLQNGDDLLPDSYGRYGLIDDAWLIHNTAYRLLESGILPGDIFAVNWQAISEADQMVAVLLPTEIRAALEQYALQMLNIIAHEVQGYQPQYGDNYLSGGKSYADRWYDVASDGLNYL